MSKQLLPVYDKPMVYYPLSTLMLAGMRDVLIISTPQDTPRFQSLLGDGSRFGMNLQLLRAAQPRRPGPGLHPGPRFIGGAPSALVLGDNIFYGHDLAQPCWRAPINARTAGATVFAYHVHRPRTLWRRRVRRRQARAQHRGKARRPKSNYAVTGLYFYDNQVCDIAASIKPSARGELEITTVNARYLQQQQLDVEIMGRGYAWLDTGTHDSLLEAGQFIATLEKRQGLKVACPEEIAYRAGWIGAGAAGKQLAAPMLKNSYGQYLMQVLREQRVLTAMKLLHTSLPGVLTIDPAVFGDERGWFCESYNEARFNDALRALGEPAAPRFVQDNHSCSKAGVLRGLHYQLPPHAQGKLVRVTQGAAFDVAVDIRAGSPTFGRWTGVTLSADNKRQLWIPPGFAHGFLALCDDTHFLYKTTDVYARACERAIRFDDAAIGIVWPLPAGISTPLVAAKDAAAPLLAQADLHS